MKLIVLFYLISLGACFPQCCRKTYYYFTNILFLLKCEISVCSSEMSLGNICISCNSKSQVLNDSSSMSSSASDISKPQVLCQSAKTRYNPEYLLLSWSWTRMIDLPFLFMIEARNSSLNALWGMVGLTNETLVEISHLDSQFRYQFRVTPVIGANSTLLPVTSDWITPLDSKTGLSAPTNITVSEFFMKDGYVEALVEWTASKETPCSYRLFWFPAIGSNYFEQKNVILPQDNLSAVLPGLLFNWNYTVTITPYGYVTKNVNSAEIWFITPTCLNLTSANFSICAPGPPLNVTVSWNVDDAILVWEPPDFTSPMNLISGYRISVVRNGLKYINRKPVDQDVLNFTFPALKDSSSYYIFEVRAVSNGGIGQGAIAESTNNDYSDAKSSFLEATSLPYYYIVPFIGVPLILVIVAVLITFLRKKNEYKYCPSGIADVDDNMRKFLIPAEKVELKEILGEGAFGTVYKGIYFRSKSREDEEVVAVKVLPADSVARRQLLYEVELMRFVGMHDHIVKLCGFTLDLEKISLVLEYCPLGDLRSYLARLKPKLIKMKSLPTPQRMKSMNEKNRKIGKQLCSYLYQVALGMEYIAGLKLIHRDIAARNILMLNEDIVKIADFGLSRDVYETKVYSASPQKKLPYKWMAPEAIEKLKFTTYSDVWSFGILMWEVFKLGKEPYPEMSGSVILEYLKSGNRLEMPHCYPEWYNLMLKCWHENPKQRPQFKQIVIEIGDIMSKMSNYTVLV